MQPEHIQPEVVELESTFRAVDGGATVDERAPALFAAGWDAYRSWYLREGEAARPSYAECAHKLRQHMPELVPSFDRLVEAVGGGDLEARFLSHWSPPPLFAACSLATWTRDSHLLIRNYDYPPLLCDTTVMASAWHGTQVMAMADCVWGALDGVNQHGLSVAIAFGGRPVVGEGFGIGLVVRYLLEFARDVTEALDMLRRVPVQLSYNVALVDASGQSAIAYIAPDRDLMVSGEATVANRQGTTEWPEHAAFCDTVGREMAMVEAVSDPQTSAQQVIDRFLQPPIYRSTAISTWGTVYTAVYDCDRRTVDLKWPDDTWSLSLGAFAEQSRARRSLVAIPPPTFRQATTHPPVHPAVLIA
ncbi:MAG TPA: C45 family peptidase [Actinomycetes bacterium]|nr:C45 family peptidase [Actinomycetes bacterium]